MNCGVGCRRGLDPALLWLWCRLAATAPTVPLAWEPPYAASVALKLKKKRECSPCLGIMGPWVPYSYLLLWILLRFQDILNLTPCRLEETTLLTAQQKMLLLKGRRAVKPLLWLKVMFPQKRA